MKKHTKFITLALAIASLGIMLTACSSGNNAGGDPAKSSSSQQQQQEATPSSSAERVVEEVADCDLPSGKYMVNKTVYDYNKTDKKVVVTEYENYSDYLNNRGTKKYEGTVKFIQYTSSITAILFNDGTYDNYFYKEGSAVKYRIAHGSIYSSGTASSPDDVLIPANGTYVSPIQERDVVDEQGNRIPTGEGGYQKENYYLFVEITATSVKLYVSDNQTSHGSTPLLSKDNYVLELINGTAYIRIPHADTYYKCSIRAKSSTVLIVINDWEKHGDYSCSCDFTKVEQ